MKNIINYLLFAVNFTLNSYSQIFFSLNKYFGFAILLISFLNPKVGLWGLLAVLIINIIATIIGFNKDEIKSGIFGFNALFLGFTLGFTYSFNFKFLLFFIISLILLLLITVWLKTLFSKLWLPFLSLPFFITYCIVSVAGPNLLNLNLDESYVYLINHNMVLASSKFHQFSHSLNDIQLPQIFISYFKTLAAGFFQTSVLSGILIAFSLLIISRIAFSLTIIGFSSAYLFFNLLGADINYLNTFLVGANFIFMSIALGCFYIIPNKYSYLMVFMLAPILVLIFLFSTKILNVFHLNAYTLPYTILTLVTLIALQNRWFHKYITLVNIQLYSAEKLIYKHLNSIQRFKFYNYAKIQLPFWGQWTVSQSHNGNETHLGLWGNAFDFVIKSNDKSFKNNGLYKTDYFCYDKPVVTPLDGYVYNIINNVEDNDIGKNNIENNWGNSIIINHTNGLFSQISHLKKDSFKCNIGDYVSKGTQIACCGNSGRSAEPHIHFQLQTSALLGAKTLYYPIAYYIQHSNTKKFLKSFEIPKKDDLISNVDNSKILIDSFTFLPNAKLKFLNTKTKTTIEWEVKTDEYNRTYIYCNKSNSIAYFVNDGTMFYFFDFIGNKKSLLFKFYMAAYRQILGYYDDLIVEDQLPISFFNNNFLLLLQDFLAPIIIFTKVSFTSTFSYADISIEPQFLKIKSKVDVKTFNFKISSYNFEITLKDSKIHELKFQSKTKTEEYICID